MCRPCAFYVKEKERYIDRSLHSIYGNVLPIHLRQLVFSVQLHWAGYRLNRHSNVYSFRLHNRPLPVCQ